MRPTALAFASLLLASGLQAEEGMWIFDNLPLKQMKQAYGFAPDQAWLDHVRLSALHFGGGSGSFVSADGLVITNHHVGRGWVQQVSGPGAKDYIKHGFLARGRGAERKIPGAALRTLERMEDVTAAVEAAVRPGMEAADAAVARAARTRELAKALEAKSGLSVSPVVLYNGGQTWLYAYKVHRDIRLVMAPESAIAAFGGDPDNFTYPRHDLDFTLFRVYENGKPYRPAHFLKVAQEGVKLGQLTFVVGHPGSTQRQITHAQMLHQRDVTLPERLAGLERQRADLYAYGRRGEEQMRQVRTLIYGLENSLKALNGYWGGLKDAAAMARVEAAERELRARVEADPALRAEAGESWARIQEALAQLKPLAREQTLMNTRFAGPLGTALALLQDLPAQARPVSELERYRFQKSLEFLGGALPEGHPFRRALLGGRTPEQAAARLLASKLQDPETVAAVQKQDRKALEADPDPALATARALLPLTKALNARVAELQAGVAEHGARIARARFKVYGTEKYPDATGSLRLSYGPVATYPANGTLQPPFTTFHGLFDRALAWGPRAENGAWALPERWREAKGRLDLATPFNFVHAVDIIGGNSGSPVLNAKGEFVGVIFDGNIQMLPGNFYYDGAVNRGVTLDVRAILEALRKVYDASFLADELTGK
jgi:hypothetical protein